MTSLKKNILGNSWKSRGAGWTLKADWAEFPAKYYEQKKVVPRYGTVFTCVDAGEIPLLGFVTKRHSKNDQGEFEIKSNEPKDISIPCVKFHIKELDALPDGMPDPNPDDSQEPPLEKMDESYVDSFQQVIFRDAGNYLIAPMTEIMYDRNPQKATMIVTFDDHGTMTLRSYWDDGYFGGYCCPFVKP